MTVKKKIGSKVHHTLTSYVIFPALSTFCFIANALGAQGDSYTHEELFDLSLEELLTVTIVSKRKEDSNEAPAVVSIITAEEIKQSGYKNLRDILNRQAHIQIVGSNLFPHNKATIRGVNASHIDNNVLLNINGRPLREPGTSSMNLDIYNFFPVSAIKQIEIVRGPGSVLYGTNAFSGVINIVTHEGDDSWKSQLRLGAGSFDTNLIEAQINGTFKQTKFLSAIYHFDSKGDAFSDIVDIFGQRGTYPMGKSGTQAFFYTQHKGLTLNALYSDTRTDNVRGVFSYPSTEAEIERYFVDFQYSHSLSSHWRIDSNITFNKQHVKLEAIPDPASPRLSTTESHIYEITLHRTSNNNLGFISGVRAEHMNGKGDANFSTTDKSIYFQLDYRFSPDTKVIVGGQYNKPDSVDGDFSPRLGLVKRLNAKWHAKLMYSAAFRNASALERFVNVPSISGNPLLLPETIDTVDAQLVYRSTSLFGSFTLFNSKQKDIVSRVFGAPIRFINGGEITYRGFEFEGNWRINTHWKASANASYQTNQSESGDTDVTYAPNRMVKVGVIYTPNETLSTSFHTNYFSASTLQNQAAPELQNPAAEDYHLATLNVTLNLGSLLKRPALNPFTLNVLVDNVFNESIFFPSINRTEVNSLPHHSRRNVLISVEGRF